MKKNIKLFGSVKTLCIAATLTAATVVIAYLCKFLTTPDGNLRITFENLPIIFAGFMFGPWVGMSVGLCADLLSALIFYGAGGINPIITLGAGCVGLMAGIMSKLPIKNDVPKLALSVSAAHIIGNMIVKSAGLMIWYGTPFIGVLPRIPLYTVIGVAEFLILLPIVKSNAIKKIAGDIK